MACGPICVAVVKDSGVGVGGGVWDVGVNDKQPAPPSYLIYIFLHSSILYSGVCVHWAVYTMGQQVPRESLQTECCALLNTWDRFKRWMSFINCAFCG